MARPFKSMIFWIAGMAGAVAYSSFTAPGPAAPDARLEVYNDSVLIADFKGVNAVYHGFSFMEDPGAKPMTEADRQAEFARVKAMDLKIARTWYRPDWACGDNLYNDFNWQTPRMHAFYAWLDQMKALNVDVALQAGWWFTRDTYHNTRIPADQTKPDPEKDPARFAEWVNASLHQLIEVKGYTNIKYLVLFTEPLNYRSGNQAEGMSSPDYYDVVGTAIHRRLQQSGLRKAVQLVGPNSGSTDTAAFVGWSAAKMNAVIDIYSWHSYNGKQSGTNPPLEYQGWQQIALAGKVKIAHTGKPFWIDEYGASKPTEEVRFRPDYGNYLAQCVAAFTHAGAQSSLLWILFDQKYPSSKVTNKDSFYNGVHRWGLVRSPQDELPNAGEPYPAWYAFSLMSRYLGGRDDTPAFNTHSADSLYVVATAPSGKATSVMVVNASHVARKLTIHFAKPIGAPMNRYLYDPGHLPQAGAPVMLPFDKQFKKVQYRITDQLPSRGVAIYTTIQSK